MKIAVFLSLKRILIKIFNIFFFQVHLSICSMLTDLNPGIYSTSHSSFLLLIIWFQPFFLSMMISCSWSYSHIQDWSYSTTWEWLERTIEIIRMDILEKDLASWIAKINPYSGEVYRVEIVWFLFPFWTN